MKPERFKILLKDYPDQLFVNYFVEGLTNGFHIGYRGPELARETPNARTAFDYPHIVRNYVKKEVAAKHTVGPFTKPPFINFVVSSIGVRAKKTGGSRLIMDLSRPFGNSVNDFVSREDYSLRFIGVDDAIRIMVELGPGALMAKVDLKGAFRLIPVHKDDWHYLGYKVDDAYYFDTVLPFGGRFSPALFDDMSKLLEFFLKHHGHVKHVLHYIDDFWWAAPADDPERERVLKLFRFLSEYLGVPMAEEKTAGPATKITFLGIELDSVAQTISVPEGKVKELMDELTVFHQRRLATKTEMQSLIGKLSFATKCIPAGRFFLRRFINISSGVRQNSRKIRLTSDFKADVEWWMRFLPEWNGTCSFLQSEETSASSMHLFTDAAGSTGCGAVFGSQWFYFPWPEWMKAAQPPIAFYELLPVYLACDLWGINWQRKRLLFHSDNLAVVFAWSKKSSQHHGMMELMRQMHFVAAKNNFVVRITHIAGIDNGMADAVSRCEWERFRLLNPSANREPEVVKSDLSFIQKALMSDHVPLLNNLIASQGGLPNDTLLPPLEEYTMLGLDASCYSA